MYWNVSPEPESWQPNYQGNLRYFQTFIFYFIQIKLNVFLQFSQCTHPGRHWRQNEHRLGQLIGFWVIPYKCKVLNPYEFDLNKSISQSFTNAPIQGGTGGKEGSSSSGGNDNNMDLIFIIVGAVVGVLIIIVAIGADTSPLWLNYYYRRA